MNISPLKKKNIHIIGISGLEGWAMFEFFISNKIKNIVGHDFSDTKDLEKNFRKNHPGLKEKEVQDALKKIKIYQSKINFKENYLKDIDKADLIFLPQSWFLYKENKPLFNLNRKGIPFLGLINIYLNFSPAKIIGITGSQGKTTTSRLTSYIFRKAGEKVYYGGNDRKAAQSLSKISEMRKNDFLILEVSHRQLMFNLKKSPQVGIILNITRNHLNEVKNFKEYQKLKGKLIKFQTTKDIAILNLDDIIVRNFPKETKAKVIPFTKKCDRTVIEKWENICFLDKEGWITIKTNKKLIRIIKKEELTLPGEHNLENILAAIVACFFCKIKPGKIKSQVKTFLQPKNCLEYITKKRGVTYYNDIASTTPESTKAAIKFLEQGKPKTASKIILIAGGEDKGMDYRNLAKEIVKKVKILILLPGSSSSKLKESILKINIKQRIFALPNLSKAVKIAKRNARRGDIILLSPNGAFFESKFGRRRDFIKSI